MTMFPNCWPPPASPSSHVSEFEPAIAGMKTLARTTITPMNTPYEVHITDIKSREPFRHHSFFEDIAIEQISGKGISGYEDAVNKAIKKFRSG